MQNLLDDLTGLLQAEQAFISDGAILRNTVIKAALNLEPRLLTLLMRSDRIKAHFFTEVAGVLVFDKVKFQDFVSSKAFLPDSYTAFKNRIGLTDGRGTYLRQSRDVVLSWPYKDCVLEGGMTKEDRGRDEVFWNTTLAPDDITRLFEPKVLTGWDAWAVAEGRTRPVGTVSDEDNLLIKGNNLLVLHSLKARYAGKVKLIYIDPPYNTGNDGFRYNDRFNHSSWLTFMRNRLEVAKDLLSRDGLLFVHCDRNEFAYLKVLLDEVMIDGVFIECITVVNNPGGRDYGGIANMHEYILCYSKSPNYEISRLDDPEKQFPYRDEIGDFELRELRNRNTTFNQANRPNLVYPFYTNPDDTDDNGLHTISLEPKAGWKKVMPAKSQGIQTVWRWGKPRSQENLNTDIKAKKIKDDRFQIVEKYRNKKRMARSVWWDKEVNSARGTLHVKSLVGKQLFTYPKPEETLNRILEMTTTPGDLVLDFFAGSGTTTAVAHKMGRRWIAVKQMDYIENLTKTRLKKVIEGARDIPTLQAIHTDMVDTGYLRYHLDLTQFNTQDFAALALEDARRTLMDCLDANHFYVNIGSLGDADFDIPQEDACTTRAFYGIAK
ncbi:MAG: site-specific DNA-methyltransferase [Rhodobacteraceae bacterium]|nr:site-specific DNA-methyltransferase [Paracoccaceae bacterium]